MTFPDDLLIFLPDSSRMSAVTNTSRKGTSPMKWMPRNIMRATQKKMMSKAVTSTEVG